MATRKDTLTSVFVIISCYFILNEGKETDKPVVITEDNWRNILEGEWMIEFYAPWCPACRTFQSTWDAIAKWSKDLDVGIGQTDVTENPGLSGRFFVTALPTIYHVKDGVFRQYSGSRSESDLISFLDEKRFIELEPVSWMLDPKSLQMSAVGLFFKAAMVIRSFYNMMTTEYGIPEWGCYLLFAIMTIILGLLLGLVIVCCCDVLFPPKMNKLPPREIRQPNDARDKNEDLIDDTKPGEDDADEDDGEGEEDKKDKTVRKRKPQKAS
ncbi:hypothetical protein SNE40_010320 [Patella caerulea]|uniref:Thioredoxin-related transmembrane protein 1 n=1 Tax=Patella caerulea TaxID=87958 RepID=A0AAN8PZV4_PATCE